MPKKRKSTSPTTTEVTLALSDLHIYLSSLEKDHQSLLNKIKKKRTELNNFVEKMRSLATEMFQKVHPSLQKRAELDQEIHSLFTEIFKTRKFGKQTHKRIESLYMSLQTEGIISPKSFQEEEDEDSELDELFENAENNHENHQNRRQYWHVDDENETPSAARTEDSKKIRQTFLKLAEIFHPDKVRDSETHKTHTEIMKEINKAYQEGDLARLLEIERQHELGDTVDSNSEDDLSRRCKKLEQQNEILKNQYDKLREELRLAKNTPEGAMVADFRKAQKQGFSPFDFMLKTIEIQIKVIRELRDFIRDFKDQKMTITDFLAGPESLMGDDEMIESFIEEFMEEMGEFRI
ncbi:MAG: J domain-containing protein [Nostocales cyanobacterium]|nr:MAG: J domain-containing protein [Nostocales cyanobacterium]TAF12648.1 MAG: J domain-containing protein [Nostocales cyanobacterium]